MSDEKVIDLRQASVNDMLRHLGNLVGAIQRSNERYVELSREVSQMHSKVDGLNSKLDALAAEMREGFKDVRSDLILMENRLLNAEQEALRAALERRERDA